MAANQTCMDYIASYGSRDIGLYRIVYDDKKEINEVKLKLLEVQRKPLPCALSSRMGAFNKGSPIN